MDVFEVHRGLIDDYRAFTTAFVTPRDRRIASHVAAELERGKQWPDPWLSLNPAFASGGTVTELIQEGLLHPESERIFRVKEHREDPGQRTLRLHRHQREAVLASRGNASYVLTTGTGSGKSLSYIVPIVDRVLRQRDDNAGRRVPGVKAIVVYPMNALANSQEHELRKFLQFGYGEGHEPVTFARYTGQERDAERERILADPPDIILTNYVMLELLLTRPRERDKLIRAARGLHFLVLDELHTYRGRQGADVAYLVRRLRDSCEAPSLQCVGTSATMASGGTVAEQRRAVAEVASRLFGTAVEPDHVIGETLQRATTILQPGREALTGRVAAGGPDDLTWDTLTHDPLASWVETQFGIELEPETGQLVRRRPTTLTQAASELAQLTGQEQPRCESAIRATLAAGSHAREPGSGRPLFAFRLHQFVAKGDTVHVSLEAERTRHITSRYQAVVPGEPEKALIPLSFCRECGQEYLVVARTTHQGQTRFEARRNNDASGGDADTGYLYVSTAQGDEPFPWPESEAQAITEARVPDSWLTTSPTGKVEILDSRWKYLPRTVHLDPGGWQTEPGTGLRAAYVPSPFTFCLRCRVSYEGLRGNEFGKLASLSAEGRSSAMTVLASSLVRRLRDLDDLPTEARKLLTFVDNRQDAALQSGHLNDFVQVALLRGALHRAAAQHPADGLTHEQVASAVVTALGLALTDFAADVDPAPTLRDRTERALREVVAYRIYLDLERGWRITMPNLEQTGLLRIDYADLAWLAEHDDRWQQTHPALRDDTPEHRQELARILLDELRRTLAIDVEVLTEPGFEQVKGLSDQMLVDPWALPTSEVLPHIGTAYPSTGAKGASRRDLYLSGRGAFGRYLRRDGQFPHLDDPLTLDDAQEVIADLLGVLTRAGLTREVSASKDGVPGYRLNAGAVIWRAGDGVAGADDPLRRTVTDEGGPRVNPFFRDLYRDVATDLAGLRAREHTAQVPSDLREEREQDFRTGSLPLLFCSPTMELGVDIASLNAVAMRNVPPTPANYAQRSGRAGRSGQPALVVTYCATGSAHDQYWFRRSDDMVSGSVAAPRLDLTNEDLVRSHVHAIWLAETGVNLRSSLGEILDISGEHPALTLLPEIEASLTDTQAAARATVRAQQALARDLAALAGATWWDDGWVERVVGQAPLALDRACDRWRQLYRAALTEQAEQNRLVNDPSSSRPAQRAASSRRREAETQLRLLRNEDSDRGQTDFYSYRYFASEGFLPGYSFPRLPLAAYIPGWRRRADDGDYLQRPRFLAISEFGPQALIYHEGARYQVTRIQLPPSKDGEPGRIDTQAARRCAACGYLHAQEAMADVCDLCGERLGATTYSLLRLQTVFTRRRERISSDEEERRRAGFELETSFRFADGPAGPRQLDAEARDGEGNVVLTLAYGDAATLRIANVGRRRRRNLNEHGFWLDTDKGTWLSDKDAADATAGDEDGQQLRDVPTKQRVIPYVQDTRNILATRLAGHVDDATATSLRYALERGIEAAFQLEDSELDSTELPDPDSRGRSLLVESAEGGAGVLRRLVDEPAALALAARTALTIAHFDPDSGEDLGGVMDGGDRCEKACYDCLLSYSNQAHHAHIDRHLISELLLELAGARVVSGGANRSAAEQLAELEPRLDSGLERDFLAWLREHEHRLPDDAQTLVPEASARPDFVYRLPSGPTAVFVDGPAHDAPRQVERDAAAAVRLEDLGWFVVRIRYDDDWAEVIGQYPSVFGQGR